MKISKNSENFSPFSENFSETIGALGEIKLIEKLEKILRAFPKISKKAPRGIGDDCAVLPPFPRKFLEKKSAFPKRLSTVDSVIFSKHFDEKVSPENAGKKLVNRNLSDIAAMGGVPADGVISLIMSKNVSTSWLEKFYEGAAKAAEKFGVEIAGGDVAAAPAGTPFFAATLALTGFSRNPLLRSGAKIGDKIFVTGTLGGSILEKHFSFVPRLAEGEFLASFSRKKITSAIDITDGILKDFLPLVPAGARAEFFFEKIPISKAAKSLGNELRRAFCDGEDYEILFTANANFAEKLERIWAKKFPKIRLTLIGEIAAGTISGAKISGISGTPIPPEILSGSAYEHFSGN